MTRQIDYFAYGSNMHLVRLRERVPSCAVLGVGVLQEHLLRFHKRSVDGSGKCNILFTGQISDRVYGVLYRMNSEEKRLLDAAEGTGHGYEVENIDIEVGGISRRAYTYIADANYLEDALLPYEWYKELVVAGATMHGLPKRYVTDIAQYKAVTDPNVSRVSRHRKIID